MPILFPFLLRDLDGRLSAGTEGCGGAIGTDFRRILYAAASPSDAECGDELADIPASTSGACDAVLAAYRDEDLELPAAFLAVKFIYGHDSLLGSDSLDLDLDVFGQSRHLHSGPCRVGRLEKFGVNGVHPAEIVHVFKENGALDRLVERTSPCLEDRAQVLESETGLFLNASGVQFAGFGIDRYRSRSEYQSIDLDPLGVGSDGLRGVSGFYLFFHGVTPFV